MALARLASGAAVVAAIAAISATASAASTCGCEATARTRAIEPLRWLHIPKAGTSFGTTVYHYLNDLAVARNASTWRLPEDARPFCDDGHKNRLDGRCSAMMTELMLKYPPKRYLGHDTLVDLRLAGHDPLASASEARAAVALFREPRARMISHYFWFEGEKERRNNVSNPSFGTAGAVHAYATQHLGCQTRMVLGQSCWSHEPLNRSEVKAAQRRLEDFAFVGITDRYDESVCLFHAMAGGSRGPVVSSRTCRRGRPPTRTTRRTCSPRRDRATGRSTRRRRCATHLARFRCDARRPSCPSRVVPRALGARLKILREAWAVRKAGVFAPISVTQA